MLRWFPLIFFLACAALLGSLMLAGKPQPTSSATGKLFQVPSFAVLMEGSATPERPAPLTLYNVFASWCVPCAAEMPALQTLAQQEKIEVVGIAWSDKKEQIDAFTTQYGNPFARIYDDAKGTWGIALGIRGVPESFVVDDKGVVLYHVPGEITETDLERITALLQGKRS